MSAQETLIVTVMAGLAVWLVTHSTLYYLRRKYLKKALVLQISSHIRKCREVEVFLDDYIENRIEEGEKLAWAARFTPPSYGMYDRLRLQIVNTFPRSLPRLIAFYDAVEEVNTLFGNFMEEVVIWKNDGRVLNKDDCRYMRGKARRITALVDQLPDADGIKRLRDLPESYDIGESSVARLADVSAEAGGLNAPPPPHHSPPDRVHGHGSLPGTRGGGDESGQVEQSSR